MKIFLTILLFYGVSADDSYINLDRPDEGAEMCDAKMKPVDLLCKYKYPGEEHRVVTRDGYDLGIHRIPYGRAMGNNPKKGPVILQHGLFSSSAHWILPGTKRGLGYILADSGYDVWMPNSRGNTFSQKHTKLDIQSPEFWDFSFHEMGYYDLPAVFDYVINATGAADVSFVGHSQGTTAFLVFNSLRTEYINKVRSAFLLGPMAYFDDCSSLPVNLFKKLARPLNLGNDLSGISAFLKSRPEVKEVIDTSCNYIKPVPGFLFFKVAKKAIGESLATENETLVDIFVDAGTYGLSLKQILHYGQMMLSRKFRQYDYGKKNEKVYSCNTPPDYSLCNARSPIHLYYSKNDFLSNVKDVKKLMKELPNVKESYLIKDNKFNAMDHIFCNDIINLEYNHLLKSLDSYYKC